MAVSVAFRKPFLAIDAAGRSFKIQDMLQRIGLEQQLLMANDGEYSLRSNALEMTYDHSERKLSSWVNESWKYLSDALDGLPL